MSIRDEEDRILKRLGKLMDNEPETPEAVLATTLFMLNRKIDMVLIQLGSLSSRPLA